MVTKLWELRLPDGNILLFDKQADATKMVISSIDGARVRPVYKNNGKNKPIMYKDDRELFVVCKDASDFEHNFDSGVIYIVRSFSAGTKKDSLSLRFEKSDFIGVEDRFGHVMEIEQVRFELSTAQEVGEIYE